MKISTNGNTDTDTGRAAKCSKIGLQISSGEHSNICSPDQDQGPPHRRKWIQIPP